MNSQEWNNSQIQISFESAEYLQRQIQYNYHSGTSVHIGFLYCAIGKNHGRETSRYIIVIPFYDPSIHGYNFRVNNPYVYFRGFAGVSSTEYLNQLQKDCDEAIDLLPDGEGKELLRLCSPISVRKFENQDLKRLEYQKSLKSSNDSLSIVDGFFEFWIYGPRKATVARLSIDFKVEEFEELVNDALKTTNYEPLRDFCIKIQSHCNSYSFPTF